MKQRFGRNSIPEKIKAAAEPRDDLPKDREPGENSMLSLEVHSVDDEEEENEHRKEVGDYLVANVFLILDTGLDLGSYACCP